MITSETKVDTYTVWKTSDGKEFKILVDAEVHEKRIEYNKFEKENEHNLEIIESVLDKYYVKQASRFGCWVGTKELSKKIMRELYYKGGLKIE